MGATATAMAEVAEQAEHVAKIAEEMGIFEIMLRKSESRKYLLEVTGDTTIEQIKMMVIQEVAAEIAEEGGADNKSPFSPSQVDIFHPDTNKILFACKKLSSLGVEEGDELRWNVRQWGDCYDTGAFGRQSHGSHGRNEAQNHASPKSSRERGKICPTMQHSHAHKQYGDGSFELESGLSLCSAIHRLPRVIPSTTSEHRQCRGAMKKSPLSKQQQASNSQWDCDHLPQAGD